MKLETWLHCGQVGLVSAAATLFTLTQQPLDDGVIEHYPRLNFSSPAPLIFHSTFSLLQQWPNTLFPAGHTIAPCKIPPNTNLYHARPNDTFPPSPEWFAFDSAMAYHIRGTFPDSHLLTFRTTKEVKCLYFDGTSAALEYDGSMDSQMLFLYNHSANVPKDPVYVGQPPRCPPGGNATDPDSNETLWKPLYGEYLRANRLCDFIKEKNLGGPGWGYEGIVRMSEGFELIWCNFSSPSTELVSWLNVSAPFLIGVRPPRLRRPPDQMAFGFMGYDNQVVDDVPKENWSYIRIPGWDRPFRESAAYEWFRVATATYGFSGGKPGRGESRAKIDSCGLFTFFDPALADESYARVVGNGKLFNLSSEGYWLGPRNKSDSREIALQKLGHRRRYQLARNVSKADGLYMRAAVEARMRDTLSRNDEIACSGIDWVTLAQTIVADYSSSLYDLRALLSNTLTTDLTNSTQTRLKLTILRGLTHQLIMPYYSYPPHFTDDTLHSAFSPDSPFSLAALERCKSQHTPPSTTSFSQAETLTFSSILTVLTSLCSTLLPLFLGTEVLHLSHFNNVTAYPDTLPPSLQSQIRETIKDELEKVGELMAWLGWTDQWTGCEPGCGVGEVCAIPMSPIAIGEGKLWEDKEEELWRGGRCVGLEGFFGDFGDD